MRIKIGWRGNGRSTKRKVNFVKPQYMKKRSIDYSSRSELVRFFMDYFIEKEYSDLDIHSITSYLKRIGLHRAERHAIVFKLGYRYRGKPVSEENMRNLKINGYFEQRKKLLVKKEDSVKSV